MSNDPVKLPSVLEQYVDLMLVEPDVPNVKQAVRHPPHVVQQPAVGLSKKTRFIKHIVQQQAKRGNTKLHLANGVSCRAFELIEARVAIPEDQIAYILPFSYAKLVGFCERSKPVDVGAAAHAPLDKHVVTTERLASGAHCEELSEELSADLAATPNPHEARKKRAKAMASLLVGAQTETAAVGGEYSPHNEKSVVPLVNPGFLQRIEREHEPYWIVYLKDGQQAGAGMGVTQSVVAALVVSGLLASCQVAVAELLPMIAGASSKPDLFAGVLGQFVGRDSDHCYWFFDLAELHREELAERIFKRSADQRVAMPLTVPLQP